MPKMPEQDPNNTLWQARALAQKMPGGEELDALLVTFQVEREKVRAILDALHWENTDALSFIDLAESASAIMAKLEKERDAMLDMAESRADGSVATDGYYAFATQLNWKYPDGDPMPIWAHLSHETQDAFVAFAKAVATTPTVERIP